jgi:hypothetical protein
LGTISRSLDPLGLADIAGRATVKETNA